LRFSNIISDLKNIEFSTKNLIKHNHFQKALPPILDFDFSTFKDKNWGDIVTIHKSHSYAYIWRSDHQAITDKVLVQPNTSFHTYNVPFTLEDHATSISVSACGNFAVVGYRSGIIYKYNLQSTIERGSFPTVSPSIVVHHKEVNGLFIDISNREMISSGVDGKVVFWDFMNHSVLLVIESEIPWILLRGCRETGFVALANLHHDIQIYDIYTRKIIRVFNGGHSRFISDLVFTPDSRRLISSSLDTTMRVWDMPSGRCVAWLSFSSGITSLAISPTSEYLCVGLYNKVGFAVFIDRSLYENIYINEEPSSPVPMNSIPSKNFSKISNQAIHSENVKSKLLDDGNTLISLSSMPRIYCTNLFYLEAIRLRNTAQTSKLIKMEIPFFLSDLGKSRNEVSVSKGLTAQSSEQQQSSSEMRGIKQSRILKGQQTHKG
jgi:U3 small nucleolar RNA-associated protein 21